MDPLQTLRRQLLESPLPRRTWAGANCVVQGALLCLRAPSLLYLALAPILINLVLYPVFGYLAWRVIVPVHDWLLPSGEPEGIWAAFFTVLSWVLWIVLGLVFGLCALLLVTVVAMTIAAPLLDRLSARAETILTRITPPEGPGVVESIVRALKAQVAFLVLYAFAFILSGIVYVVPVLGAFAGPAVQALVTVVFLCVQFLELPADRRREGMRDRLRLVRKNLGASVGFGAACWFMMLFPFTLPFVVVGGTIMYVGLHPESPVR